MCIYNNHMGYTTTFIQFLFLQSMASHGPDIVFVCVGGGGLLAGIASYFKAVSPDVKIIGVEAMDAAGMTESLRAGKVVTLPKV